MAQTLKHVRDALSCMRVTVRQQLMTATGQEAWRPMMLLLKVWGTYAWVSIDWCRETGS
jgi:hypothetical protein